jgi:hypothetical protein
VKQLVTHLPRAALWVVVLLLLAGTLATVATAQASSPSYTLYGQTRTTGGVGAVPAGVQVDLVSRATGATYTTTTASGGTFSFTTASTSGALVPGYWGVWIPPQSNLSLPGCKPCGIFSSNQNPQFGFINATALTTSTYPSILTNVNVVISTGQIGATVKYQGQPVAGAQVQLLAPQYNNFALASNVTATNGTFTLKVPAGSWVLKTTLPGFPNVYNFSAITVSSFEKVTLPTINLASWLFSGTVFQASNPNAGVPNGGNVTLWDGADGYIYSNPTFPGGSYAVGTYPAGFSGTTGQSFDVVLSTVGYTTIAYTHTSSGTPFTQNAYVTPMTAAQRGIYTTTLNFSGINVNTGTGSLSVKTAATLGNDTVFATLPNASIGQMWAQLGLDFNHATTLPFGMLPSLYAFENASGPFFPAVQAGVAINGTTFSPSANSGTLASQSSTCTSGSCGLSSANTINLGWNQVFSLNGSVTKNSGTYTLSFGFQHPTSSDTYNYTVVLPAGYVLSAGTAAPAQSKLVAAGPGNTWTSFTLVSQPSAVNGGSASFTIVKYANLTANVNASVRNFAFSSSNVLNSTHGNYTVVVGLGQNVTFSALNSTYPAGTNGTSFQWVFGDGNHTTTTQPTTNHTYTAATGATPDSGKLTVTSSGGQINSTTFSVWVGEGPVTAVISSNATAAQNRTAGTTPYIFVNWSTVLYFNASASNATISPSAPIPGVLSVASYVITAKGFKTTQNYSVGQGAYFGSNYSYQFLGAGVYYNNHTTIGGTPVFFKGWQYNLTLTVWDGTGQSAAASLIILVNDTQMPVSGFQILNSLGKPVTGSGVVTAANLTAKVQFNGVNASDPNNGSITKYYWLVTNSGNSTVHSGWNQTTIKPYPTAWLAPQTKPYTVNLTVWDLNGNKGWTTQSLAVTTNSTNAVIMSANNLTGPSSVNSGTSYTFWVNFTTVGGPKSVAQNVQVSFYTTPPSSSNRAYIAGTPGTVQFFNYTSGVVNSLPFATGTIPTMNNGTTYRAQITWTPTSTGNFVLYANATASNEYSGNYNNGPQVISQSITVNPNPTTQLLEYVAIIVAVIAVILAIFFLYRRRTRRTVVTRTTTRSGGRSKTTTTEDDEDDDDT